MRVLKQCMFGIILALLTNACSDNSVVSSYDENISTSLDEILITFNTPIVQDADVGTIHRITEDEKIIKINGEGVMADYAYKSPYQLIITPYTALLKPNAKYTMSINLSSLEDSILKNSISLPIHTNQTDVDANISASYIDSENFTLDIQANFSQKIDMSDLAKAIESNDTNTFSKAIKLEDSSGVFIPFKLQVYNDSLTIQTEPIQIKENIQQGYTLTLKASYFGFQKDEILHYERYMGNLEIIDIKTFNAQNSHIQIHFSDNLGDNPHLQDFIDLSPDIQTKISQNGSIIRIDGNFNPSQTYKLYIKEGIKGMGKTSLQSPKEQQIIFNQIPPSLAFSQQGVFLHSNSEQKIAIRSINVKNITLKVSKIYPNNITSYLYKQNLIGEMQFRDTKQDEYDEYDYEHRSIYADFERLGDEIIKQDFALDMQKNQWIQTEIDLSPLKDKNGIFIIDIGFDENGVDYEFPDGTSSWSKKRFFEQASIQKHLIFSNIALLAQQINDKLEVFALDSVSNKPLSDVQITAINAKNQNIYLKRTNTQGFVSFDDAKPIMYLNATKGLDTTILKLNAPLMLDGFDVSGLEQIHTQAYIYSDRGVYRPGESANINIIARADSKPITHPIQISIISPQGKNIVENITLKEQLFGLFSYKFTTENSYPTGIYKLKAEIGGSTFWHNISVESVVPNRIKVDISGPQKISLKQLETGNMGFEVNSNYLFGAPANDLDVEANFYLRDVEFYAKAYSDYSFIHPSNYSYSTSIKTEGKLDANGHIFIGLDTKEIDKIGKNFNGIFSAKVFESGGRAVSAAESVNIEIYDSFIGIKKLENRHIGINSPIRIPIIVLSNDTQEPIADKNLRYTIYHNSYSWWWDYRDNSDFTKSFKEDKNTNLIQDGVLVSKLEPTMLTFTPNQSGEFFIEIEDEENNVKNGVFLYASEDGEPVIAPKLTQLKLQADKQSYLSTDKAKISFESTKNAKALVTIVRQDEIIERFWLDTQEGQTSFNIPIKDSYAPNIYVAVHLLQDYNTLDNDRSQRLYGAIPLMVENKDSKLDIKIDAPQAIRPNTDFNIKLSNKEGKKVAYTLAIVDEGLLDLTNFISPNPWAYFYQKLAFTLSAFDNYDEVIGRTIGKILQTHKVGGDEVFDKDNRKNFNQVQRFKPVVFYSAPIMSNEQGEAHFTYNMPAYMGSVRIMAVALNDKSYGSAYSNMKVSAPVAMLSTIPRSLKIGDSFTLAIEVIPTQENVGKTTLKFESGSKITLDKKHIVLNSSDKTSQIAYVNAKVSDEYIGEDFINITLENNDFRMYEKTEIDILPNNPYTTISKKFTLEPQSTLTLQNPKKYVKDSQNAYVLVSQSPIMSIDHRLKWLIRYPYGCLEQTTSSVLPQLFMDTLSKGDFIDKPTIVKNINAGIARIGKFQTSDGGFAYWQGERKSDAYGSAYAGHFLLLAKSLGYYVPESMLKAWVNYEINYVKRINDAQKAVYPLYLLAISGNHQVGLLNNIYENALDTLEVSDKWLLAAAYKLANLTSTAEKITKNLPTKSPERSKNYYNYSYGSQLRDDAMILKAYGDIYGTTHKELFSHILQKLEGEQWYSTQSLGYSLLALSQFIPTNDKIENINIEFDGKKYEMKEYVKIPFDTSHSKITSNNTFPLFVNHIWDGILLDKDIKPKAQKIALKRIFVDENNNPINVESLPSAKTFYIKLTLHNAKEPVSIDNVAITQNIPSGWEIENTRFNDKMPEIESKSPVTYTDIRDDKIMWFTNFNGNDISMLVKINTVTPGTYFLPPATAEAMYDNSFLANTESMPVTVSIRDKH